MISIIVLIYILLFLIRFFNFESYSFLVWDQITEELVCKILIE